MSEPANRREMIDVANKTLRRAYEDSPQTFTPIAGVTLPDFISAVEGRRQYTLAEAAKELKFPSAPALRTWLYRHRDVTEPRYRRMGPRPVRMVTGWEIDAIRSAALGSLPVKKKNTVTPVTPGVTPSSHQASQSTPDRPLT